jgi:regulator of protease activity HflC (stomatin/prohibitin superfamily)
MMEGFNTKKILGYVLAFFAVCFVFWGIVSYKKVPAGNVGVHVYLLGGEKGVDTVARGVGRHFIGWQQELYLYPTFTQNYTWTREWVDDNGDGRQDPPEIVDESLSFQDKQGLEISADVGIAYNVDPSKVTVLFQKYRKGVDEITDTVLRNYVRDALNTETSTMTVEEIYGVGKAALMERATQRVKAQVEPFGIRIEKIYWINSMRLPKGVQAALNAKIEATQKAQQRENEVAQAKAEADKAREEARGVADAQLLRAEAEAKSIAIRGEALRNNPNLVELTVAEKWNGKYPDTLIIGDGKGQILQIPMGNK